MEDVVTNSGIGAHREGETALGVNETTRPLDETRSLIWLIPSTESKHHMR